MPTTNTPPSIPSGEVHLYRANGTREVFKEKPTIPRLQELTGADVFDTVNFRNGSVMMVDDQGHSKNLPINLAATGFYRFRAPNSDHVIVGDVVIVNDSDFGGAEDDE